MKRLMSPVLLITVLAGSTIVSLAQESQVPPSSGPRAALLRQLDDAATKLASLAEAIPQEKYSWRPGEGVRSISEVFMHVAGGNYLIAQSAGAKAPADLSREMEKISDKAKVVETLKHSFDHVRQALLSTADSDLAKETKLFGRPTTVGAVFLALVTHGHEHLGQSIAYARMNNITPPWTAARQAPQPAPANP